MTPEEWKGLNTGDVVLNTLTNEAYTVSDSNVFENDRGENETVIVLSRSRICSNPKEWELKRVTVDYNAA